jgi:hypothetical protein
MKQALIRGIKSIAAVFAVAVALAACSAAGTAQQNDAKIGCKFNAQKACQGALTAPITTSTGFTTSNQSYITQNSPTTTWVMVPVKAPGGSEVDVQCQVNYAKKQVIYAYPTASGPVSDNDQQWFHQTGMCIGTEGTQATPKIGAQE